VGTTRGDHLEPRKSIDKTQRGGIVLQLANIPNSPKEFAISKVLKVYTWSNAKQNRVYAFVLSYLRHPFAETPTGEGRYQENVDLFLSFLRVI